MLTSAWSWIEASPVAEAVGSPAVYPFVSAVHILGIATLLGSILPVDLRLLRLLGPQVDDALPTLTRLAVAGFVLVAISGALLASVRISEYAQNRAFLAKMAIVLAAGLNVAVVRIVAGRTSAKLVSASFVGRAAGGASLLLWVNAVIAGRWIAFV